MGFSPRPLLAHDKGKGVAVSRETLPELRRLVGDCHVSHLAKLENLTFLDFGPFMSLTPASVESLQANLKQLRYLAIPQGQLLDAASIALIGQMKTLKGLALNKVHFASKIASALVHLPALELLSLKSSTLTDADLLEMALCEKLEDLDVSHCAYITCAGLMRYQELIECRHFYEITHIVTPDHVCCPRPLKVVRTVDCKGLKRSGYHAMESRPERNVAGRIMAWNDYSPAVVVAQQ
jgi:hypothetical protein